MPGAPFGYGLWLWFKNNPWAQGVALGLAAVVAGMIYVRIRVHQALKLERLRATLRARKTADQIVIKMKEESDERLERAESRADRIRARPDSGDAPADQLPEPIRRYVVSD